MRAPLADIVRALGGELYDQGRRARVPGPGHSPADRSLSLWVVNGRLIVHSFAGDDWRLVLDALRERGLVDGEHRLRGAARDHAGLAPTPTPPARRRLVEALWAEAQPAEGGLGRRHARLRNVRRSLGPEIRLHPGLSSAVYSGRGLRRPALLAAIRDAAGKLVGLEATYLAADGRRAAIATPRKTLGARPAGSAVRLDPPAEVLLVGEGVFTCLSASEALRMPAWALLSADNLARWSPPPLVRRLVIAADRGRVGEGAARRLSSRMAAEGVPTEVRLPPGHFEDWNEAALGGGEIRRDDETFARRS